MNDDILDDYNDPWHLSKEQEQMCTQFQGLVAAGMAGIRQLHFFKGKLDGEMEVVVIGIVEGTGPPPIKVRPLAVLGDDLMLRIETEGVYPIRESDG